MAKFFGMSLTHKELMLKLIRASLVAAHPKKLKLSNVNNLGVNQ